jgi:16S rRNA (guanine966-N2)-methyltransferase
MRITSGAYRGRILQVPDGSVVRPTSDKVRQAIFNMLLQYDLPADAVVVDGFAGSGALGLEALSRGARFVTFFDVLGASLAAVKTNIQTLGVGPVTRVVKGDVTKAGKRIAGVDPAHLVFLDPPYRKGLVIPALRALIAGGWAAEDGLIVVESELEWECPVPVLDRRDYGDTAVTFVLADHAELKQAQN